MDWLNRIGIILNFLAGFLMAPELIGIERLKRAEEKIEDMLSKWKNRQDKFIIGARNRLTKTKKEINPFPSSDIWYLNLSQIDPTHTALMGDPSSTFFSTILSLALWLLLPLSFYLLPISLLLEILYKKQSSHLTVLS
jgi:hypothetical protein